MPSKIQEIITEPNKIYVGSVFKLKIKVINDNEQINMSRTSVKANSIN